jgi:hypothetical protein
MPSRRFRPARNSVAALLVGAVYAAVASGTAAFSAGADFAVALALGAATAGLIAWWNRWEAVPKAIPARWWPWALLAVALVMLEVLSYLALPRSSHPTLSSISERIMALRVIKATLLLAWLWLGFLIVRPK